MINARAPDFKIKHVGEPDHLMFSYSLNFSAQEFSLIESRFQKYYTYCSEKLLRMHVTISNTALTLAVGLFLGNNLLVNDVNSLAHPLEEENDTVRPLMFWIETRLEEYKAS